MPLVTVNILGKEYQVSCPEGEKDALIASAKLVHLNMEEIKASGKIVGVDRMAVMAALNLAHELIVLRADKDNDLYDMDQICVLKDKVSAFLDEVRQLENI